VKTAVSMMTMFESLIRQWRIPVNASRHQCDIIKVKELLGHRHVTTTQFYDKRRRSLKEGASHDVPI